MLHMRTIKPVSKNIRFAEGAL